MAHLNLDPNIAEPDEFYSVLMNAHRGLSREKSDEMSTRLLLVLANHIGDGNVLKEAVEVAREAA